MDQKNKFPIILEISDSEIGLKGWMVIDSVINDQCCGGLRMSPCVSREEVADLARAMTLKFGFLGMPHGGAKAGIICEEDIPRERKLELLSKFFMEVKDQIAPYVYKPYPDVNTTKDDIFDALIMSKTSAKKKDLIPNRGGWYTGMTTIASAKVGASYLGIDFSKATIAIEGFGKVGSAVASDLYSKGNKVVAISTSQGALCSPQGLDIPELIRLYEKFGSNVTKNYDGAEKLEKEKVCELDVDIFLPCATGYTVTIDNAPKVRAKLISPGANVPLTEEAEEELWRRGVLCIPYFISNSGGVLGGTMQFAGFGRRDVTSFVDNVFSRQVELIFEQASKKNVSPKQVAEELVADRFTRMKVSAENKTQANRIFEIGLDIYRSGIVPKWVCRTLAGKYFRKRIEGKI